MIIKSYLGREEPQVNYGIKMSCFTRMDIYSQVVINQIVSNLTVPTSSLSVVHTILPKILFDEADLANTND